LEIFQFKKFIVKQNSASVFKVNTEAVLLSAWVTVREKIKILEIGSGTGVISLGLLQRLKETSHITTIDIDVNAYHLTLENILLNNATNVEVKHASLEDFSKTSLQCKFDLILSNPPFFETTYKSTKPRNIYAKYTNSLSYEDLVETAVKHLKDNGILALVLPFEVLDKIVAIAAKNKLYIHRQLTLYSRPHKRPLRILMEFANNNDIVQPETTSLCIKDSKSEYTESYKGYLNQYYTIF
jgi:tRNA1Val (adenine37-N6)-methyltransferase